MNKKADNTGLRMITLTNEKGNKKNGAVRYNYVRDRRRSGRREGMREAVCYGDVFSYKNSLHPILFDLLLGGEGGMEVVTKNITIN